ncbi:hypothetical protein BP6252_00649 [Coleophoma cylindrospora]|uniref:ubiquitinyl hydrolase 1 n=1 Tax=Coleophoma cylindrospora TaxID=1849047 RepID=A0A3D8SQP3_9HELO|nr:hypothetical protein BP6252_00649 [Coleophoma cylindrospora]
MNPTRKLQDLLDGDPNYENEYHQDYREPFWTSYTSLSAIFPLFLALAALIYHVLQTLDFDLLPLPQLVWHIVVYLTPSRLLDAIDSYQDPLRVVNPELRGLRKTHAAKSEVMRRILGMDAPGGILSTVTQAGRRRLSTLPGIGMVAQSGEGRPAGLGNWDNSCYQNSVLQGLAALRTLPNYLANARLKHKESDETDMPEAQMAEALEGLIETLNDPANNGKRIWTPAALKSMSSWQQQDAQEYFSKVLDEIDKEVRKAADSTRDSPGFESEPTHNSGDKQPSPKPVIRNPLEGLIAQRVGCTKCGFSEGLSMIPFNCLTVPLGRAWEYNVSECLDEYTKLEPIEGVECGKCTLLKFQRLLSTILERLDDTPENATIRTTTTQRLAAVTEALEDDDYEEKTLIQKCSIPSKSRVSSTKSRQAVIARPPKSLVVHFNRSLFDELTGELRKNYSEVRFPKILDLGPWCLGSAGSRDRSDMEEWLLNPDESMIASQHRSSRLRGPFYELRAVVTHYGRHENGHYICYKKHPSPVPDEKGHYNEQWWSLSDDDVMRASEEKALGQGGVFMLFYDCIQPAVEVTSNNDMVESMPIKENTDIVEAAIAASIPLPAAEHTDLLDVDEQTSSFSTRDESVATSVSDTEDDERHEGQQNYKPTEAIVVSPYVPSTGVYSENDGSGQKELLSPGSLVMV